MIKNIINLASFERFLRLCAGRVGQLLNMQSLALEVGVDSKTINAWIGVLESSFVIFRLHPYHQNFNKRIVKMPKLYFYDTGLASALLGIENSNQFDLHYYKGALFENLVVVELLKSRFNKGKSNNLFFWRDSVGHELDIVAEKGRTLIPIEVKSGLTITNEFFKGLKYWQKITQTEGGYVVYSGSGTQKRSQQIEVVPYNHLESVEDAIS